MRSGSISAVIVFGLVALALALVPPGLAAQEESGKGSTPERLDKLEPQVEANQAAINKIQPKA